MHTSTAFIVLHESIFYLKQKKNADENRRKLSTKFSKFLGVKKAALKAAFD